RMERDPAGVLIATASSFLEIFPPTKRITPFEKDEALSSVPLLGFYTNLSMTRSEPGPTVKVEPSTSSTCTRPLVVVLMRSLKKIDLPILIWLCGDPA